MILPDVLNHCDPFPLGYAEPIGSAPIVTSSRGLHLLALATTVATFPLIFMGGLVTSHHAGMSVPDWPNSYGYNMFLFPPSKWVGGILYEHTHRLMATIVGMLSITMVAWAWRSPVIRLARLAVPKARERRADSNAADSKLMIVDRHRWLALAVLLAVIFQGVLGGLRVVLVKLDLAIIHACVAQAFFCLAAFAALITSRWWQTAPDLSRQSSSGRKLIALGLLALTLIYLQLIAGATMRHYDAGLAIPDLPLAYGKLLPPTTDEGLAAINHQRAFDLNLDPVTLTQVWLHFAHRIGAVLVTISTIALIALVLLKHRRRGLTAPAVILGILLLAQVTLGVLTVLLRKPADVASTHVAVGALVLVTSFILAARTIRIYGVRRRTAERRIPDLSIQARRTRESSMIGSQWVHNSRSAMEGTATSE